MPESGRSSTKWKITWFKILSPSSHTYWIPKLDWCLKRCICIWLNWTPKLFHPCNGWLLAFFCIWFCGHVLWTINSRDSRVCAFKGLKGAILRDSAASSMELALVKSQNAFSAHCIVLRHINTTLAIKTNKRKQTESEWRYNGSKRPKMHLLSQANYLDRLPESS